MKIYFFKQKTAYEINLGNWSSDVCSSNLHEMAQMSHEVYAQQKELSHLLLEIEKDRKTSCRERV